MSYTTRTCSTCQVDFQPSSRHLSCPGCRSKASRKPCPSCGSLIQSKSTTCYPCSPVQLDELNPRWKGGKVRHKAGYAMLRMKEHPRAKGNNGYVFEHILVMEETIGRMLLSGENVHHKNGVKDDNRPENLELWSTNQPSGQRVEDKILWAIETLKLYAPELLS